jgi:hypothetical protein
MEVSVRMKNDLERHFVLTLNSVTYYETCHSSYRRGIDLRIAKRQKLVEEA